ncbi:hypothetical protein ACQPZP_33295 [Spirillospora sp. CA-142024]
MDKVALGLLHDHVRHCMSDGRTEGRERRPGRR